MKRADDEDAGGVGVENAGVAGDEERRK